MDAPKVPMSFMFSASSGKTGYALKGEEGPEWTCHACNAKNKSKAVACANCHCLKPFTPSVSLTFGKVEGES